MPRSSWRKTWREDLYRVLCSMSPSELAGLQRWGLEKAEGRRVFVGTCQRLSFDITYASYVIQRTALAAPAVPLRCPTCGSFSEHHASSYLAVSRPAGDQSGSLEYLLQCSGCIPQTAHPHVAKGRRTA